LKGNEIHRRIRSTSENSLRTSITTIDTLDKVMKLKTCILIIKKKEQLI
jgi:hypothetical protein